MTEQSDVSLEEKVLILGEALITVDLRLKAVEILLSQYLKKNTREDMNRLEQRFKQIELHINELKIVKQFNDNRVVDSDTSNNCEHCEHSRNRQRPSDTPEPGIVPDVA